MIESDAIRKIRKEVIILRSYVVLVSAALAVFWFTGFAQSGGKQRFSEIDVERLNIIEADGKFRFVLTNGSRAPGAIIGGKEIRRDNSNNAPAILFYNEEGDESGALVTVGKRKADGKYYAASRLMFDRFRHDEMLSLQYYEDDGSSYAGLYLQDAANMPSAEYIERSEAINSMPDGPAKTDALKKFQDEARLGAAPRLFIGKNRNKDIMINLRDNVGNSRLRLQVDSLGAPRMDFLDASGAIIYSLPDSGVSKVIR